MIFRAVKQGNFLFHIAALLFYKDITIVIQKKAAKRYYVTMS